MKKLMIATEVSYIGDIDETLEVQDLHVGDGSLLQITKQDGEFIVTNGMDGYGFNIRDQYKDTKLFIADLDAAPNTTNDDELPW